MEIPHVAVKLMGPGDLTTGLATGYELVVLNSDNIPLSGLILRLELPSGVEVKTSGQPTNTVATERADDGATLLTWSVGHVAAGCTTKLPLQLRAASSRNFAVAIEWTVLPQTGIDELTVKQADLQVALEGPVEVDRNAPNVYRLRVSNPGNATARNVKVQVSAAAEQASEADIGDLAPGESEVIEMDLTFEKAGRIEIGAHALADGGLKRDTNIAVAVRQALLEAKLIVPTSVPQGSTTLATVELKNSGDGSARQLKAGLAIPPESEIVNLPSGVVRQGDKLIWDVEHISAGQTVTVPIEIRLPTAGTHELRFACATRAGIVASATAPTVVEAFSDLQLSVSDPPSPAPLGAPVTYELNLSNRGTREARDVKIVAQFSEGIEPQSSVGWKHRIVPGQVIFDPVASVAAGETIKIQIVAKANVAGMHRFRAEVRCEENDARLVGEESTRYLESAGRIASPPSTTILR